MNQNDFTVVINFYDAVRILILIFGVFILLRLLILNLSTHVNYVKFNTELNIFSKKKHYPVPTQITLMYLYLIFAGLLLCEYEKDIILISIIRIYPFFGSDPFDLPLKNITTVSRVISVTSPLYMFSISVAPVTCSPYQSPLLHVLHISHPCYMFSISVTPVTCSPYQSPLLHVLHISHPCYLLSMPSCISSLVLFIYYKCTSMVINFSNYYIERHPPESWTSLPK